MARAMAMPAAAALVFIVMAAVVAVAVVLVMVMVMMVAAGIGVISKVPLGKGLRRSVRRPLNAGIELDPRIGEGRLRSHADAAADQGIRLYRLQKSCKRAVAASVCIHDLFGDDLAFLNIVQLELLGMTEMLKNLSVFISDRYSHRP